MPSLTTARWIGFALLASSLSLAVALALTWANGQLTRRLLWGQSQALEDDPTQPWRMEIEALAGGLSDTVCRLRLRDSRYGGLRFEVSAQLQHRLLTTRFAGDVYLLADSRGLASPVGDPRQGLASFHGQARYRPVSGVVWSTVVQGQAVHFATEGLNWSLEPWSALMAGDGSARLSLSLPRLKVDGPQVGVATIRGVELTLENDVSGNPGSRPRLRAHGRAEALELGLPWGRADASGVGLAARIRREPDGWPFNLQLSAPELVYKGFPFTRVSGLRYRVEGRAKPLGSAGDPGAGSGIGALRWRSIHSLQGDSGYGPMHGQALATGTMGWSGVPSLSEVRLTGRLPGGLWSVLERLRAGLAAHLVEAGLVRPEGAQVAVRAEYRAGAWHALGEGP